MICWMKVSMRRTPGCGLLPRARKPDPAVTAQRSSPAAPTLVAKSRPMPRDEPDGKERPGRSARRRFSRSTGRCVGAAQFGEALADADLEPAVDRLVEARRLGHVVGPVALAGRE